MYIYLFVFSDSPQKPANQEQSFTFSVTTVFSFLFFQFFSTESFFLHVSHGFFLNDVLSDPSHPWPYIQGGANGP